ncbi:MAG TPA: trypsin-like peptidase domain-containing protein [Nocardioides sp.]|uniref:S1C family serine protease n=1 Tax=Nocardioides sp. TaxID=35761 RepID=UPI002F42A23F
MTDEHPDGDPGLGEETAPLTGPGTDSWVPPREQPPPHRWAPPGPPPSTPYARPPEPTRPAYPPPGTQPYPVQHRPPEPPRGRVSGWVWPAVSVLALVIGVIGGVLGGAAYENLHDSSTEGRVSGGLEDSGTVSKPPLPAGNHSVASVAQRLLPSTIQVLAEYQGRKDGATGSGFVLDRSGHYITNNHVVADAVEHGGPIEIVDQRGDKYVAKVVGRSPTYDLAVLYVKGGPHLPPASLGSARVLRVGDQVVAFGSPLGLSSTVTAGIVSALNRPVTTSDTGSNSYINAVQTDAAINPGNSGGPLVDLAGRVVGVNSAIATTGSTGSGEAGNIGVGFAIPIDQVKITADQILRTGEASYPVIGATVDTGDTSDVGAKILKVNTDSPAAKGGLRKDDIVTEVAGEKVSDGIALIVAIRSHQPGDTVRFTIRRGGSQMSLKITLGSQVG